nr:hypothetical protein CFP56_09350 [Quercus suber]
MEDWQDQAFSQKHIPKGRAGRGKGKGPASFDVKKTFGAYTITGNAIDRAEDAARIFHSFEVHGLDDTGEGLIGSFSGGGTTSGVALLTGSRRVLERLVAEHEDLGEPDAEPRDGRSEESDQSEDGDESDEESTSGIEASDRKEAKRFQAFEKNSFRKPKFWMQWKAPLNNRADGSAVVESNRAYIVFSGNDCKTFKGTMSSEVLGWKDVAIAGRKTTSKARECSIRWHEVQPDLSGMTHDMDIVT